MKYIFTLLLLLTSSVAFAHPDHLLGEGGLHMAYHLIFWTLLACVIFKGSQLFIKFGKKANYK